MRSLRTLDAQSRSRLKDRLREELAREPDVVFAYLHGSFLTDQPFHDVDIGLYFGDPKRSARTLEIGERLAHAIHLPVDARPLDEAPKSFLFHVFRGELLLCRDDELHATILEDTMRCYFDIAPLLRQAAREAFGE